MILKNNLLFTDTDFCNYAQKNKFHRHSHNENIKFKIVDILVFLLIYGIALA